MYGRQLNVFPPPLLDATDNFFSTASEHRGRLHVGVLQAALVLDQRLNKPRPRCYQQAPLQRTPGFQMRWLTLLDVGHVLQQPQRVGRRHDRSPTKCAKVDAPIWWRTRQREFNAQPIELTSRRSSSELSEYRGRLNHKLGLERPVVDVLHTSNMFQVGIDIKRLGVMAIVGQPRSNSEYIQSSGRVGRGDGPGLSCPCCETDSSIYPI